MERLLIHGLLPISLIQSKGLTEGHDYILTEITAPNGFVKAESIKFTVSKEKKNQAVVMKDKQVKISKTDLTGEKEVVGAHLEVRDEFNKVVDSWTSSEEAHYVSGLEEGKKYSLIETTAQMVILKQNLSHSLYLMRRRMKHM